MFTQTDNRYGFVRALAELWSGNIREAFDQCELMLDLTTVVLVHLLRLLELGGWSILFQSDLSESVGIGLNRPDASR